MFPGTEVRLMGLLFPGSSFKPFLRMGVAVTFFQFSGMSPRLHDFSKFMESGLPTTSDSSLNVLGWIFSGPIDLQLSSSYNSSHTNSSFNDGGSVFVSTKILVPKARNPRVMVKTEVKIVLRTSALSALLVTHSPLLLNRRSIFSFCFCLLLTYLTGSSEESQQSSFFVCFLFGLGILKIYRAEWHGKALTPSIEKSSNSSKTEKGLILILNCSDVRVEGLQELSCLLLVPHLIILILWGKNEPKTKENFPASPRSMVKCTTELLIDIV